jgi:hypothetical protein
MRDRVKVFVCALLLALAVLPACSSDALHSVMTKAGVSKSVGSSGVTMRAKKGTATLDITRATPGASKPDGIEPDTWTVFVYLCGSDLESDDGSATDDLGELVGASGSDNVRFVVETGGAKRWYSDEIKAKKLQRFLVQDGSIQEVDRIDSADMGDANTLADFLTWGVENYPAEHMGVVLWNHGGGSISGVCFDERNDDDSLMLRELDDALAKTYASMWDKFEFVGFDACLMSTLETANVLASYANYLFGSEEVEPGNGWEYSTLMEYLAQNPACSGLDLGREEAQAYMDSMEDAEDRDKSTFSVIDLSNIDALLQSFNAFSQELSEASEDASTLAAMVRGIRDVDNFGGNNNAEGYTNMVDLGGLVNACADYTASSDEVIAALQNAVAYHTEGATHAAAQGMSVYYPLKVEDSDELAVFEKVCVSPYYLSFVDRLMHGATYVGGDESDAYDEYDDDTWFGEGGFWEWLWSDEDSGEGTQSSQDEGYWDFVDEGEGESTAITFDAEPQLDEDGIYWFRLDEDGLNNTAAVSAMVYEYSDDGEDLICLGETYDVDADWDTGEFEDDFDGKWLSLPDGQNLCIYAAETADDYVVYTSPILLNDRETNLRMRQYDSGRVVVEGAWDGIGEDGAAARGITKIKKGDVIVPLFDYVVADTGEWADDYYEGDEYKVKGKLKVTYDQLYAGDYDYSFRIYDVFGGVLTTESTGFGVDEDGSITFFD